MIKVKLLLTIMGISACLINMSWADGKTGPCTPPTGKIELDPNQECSGAKSIGIGRSLTLKATDLKDEDCYCGHKIQDTIDPSTGVKWTVSSGTLSSGDIGTPKTWTAPVTTASGIDVKLLLDDTGTPPATDDGGFTEVQSAALKINVVVPDDATWSPADNTPTCTIAGQSAKKIKLVDTVSKKNCSPAVDFSGLHWTEDNTPKGTITGCGFGPGAFGSASILHVGTGNTVNNGYDSVGFNCTSAIYPPRCNSYWALDWKISTATQYSSGTWYTVITRKYNFSNDTDNFVDASAMTITVTK